MPHLAITDSPDGPEEKVSDAPHRRNPFGNHIAEGLGKVGLDDPGDQGGGIRIRTRWRIQYTPYKLFSAISGA